MVERNFIARGCLDGGRFEPAANFGRSDLKTRSGRESGRMHRLANVANRFLPARMPVQITAARSKVEHREAHQHCCEPLERSSAQQ